MAQKRTGLTLHSATPGFLARAEGVVFEGDVHGMPLYRDARGKRFWGGYGSFYTLCADNPGTLTAQARTLGQESGLVETCFSVSSETLSTPHVNPVLMIPPGASEGERMRLYDGKTRNQTRRAREAPLSLSLVRGTIPPGWYELYIETRRRLGSVPRSGEYFRVLAESFGDSLYFVLAEDTDTLVAATTFIRCGEYVHLLDNVSRPSHWPLRVNNLVYDEMIRLAIAEGVRVIDFGLTGAADRSHLDFKKGFGGVPWHMVTRTYGSPVRRLAAFAGRLRRAAARRILRRADM